MIHRLVVTALVVVFAASAIGAVLPAPVQITLSGDGRSENWSTRASPTSRGQILFVGSDDVRLFNGTSVSVVQNTISGQAVETTVFGLGSGSGSSVIAGWRRGAGTGWVSIDGGTPSEVTLNPESVAIRDGSIFMVLQTGETGTGQHAFQINPADGTRVQVSSGVFQVGANRVATSQGKAAWTFQPTNADPVSIGYWDGTETILEDGTDPSIPSSAGGKLVYSKTVSGIQQVFLFDPAVSPTPFQISNETDPNVTLDRPQTDGRHVAWYRYNTADGSNPQIVLRGGLVFPTGSLQRLHLAELPFQLDRGQLLWKRAAGGFQYDNGLATFDLDPSPATNADVTLPWLTDGYIAFLAATPASGTDREVFRVTASTPLAQPQPPLLVAPLPGSAQVQFDPIIGATSYNAYVAYEPGVTKDNYTTLDGGRKIENVTSGFTILDIPVNTTYYVAITAVDSGTEGPSSRTGSTTVLGSMTWNAVGGLGALEFFSVAADPTNSSLAYAGGSGSIYKSSNGGINWSEVLGSTTLGTARVRSLLARSPRVLAGTRLNEIWRSADNGGMWTSTLAPDGNFGLYGAFAEDPSATDTIYAGDFPTSSPSTESRIMKSVDGGVNWTRTGPGPIENEDIEGRAVAAATTTPTTIYAGGNGNPIVAKTTDGGSSWQNVGFTATEVQSLSVDPNNPSTVYAALYHRGVFKTTDGGGNWTEKNNGLAGTSTELAVAGAGFNSILVDPENSNLIHLGAGNGYWFSLDGGESWQAANSGFGTTPWIYALAMTTSRRLIAATDAGLYLMSFAQPPVVSSVSPDSGNTGGGASVTITGSAFQTGATVTFGGTAATSVSVVDANTITATTPAHASGAVDVVVANPDFQSGTLANGFTYVNTPNIPENVLATAQTTETSILVTWSESTGATSYQVWRRAPGVVFTQIDTPTTNSYTDTVTSHTSYLYRIRAVNLSGASADSAPDLATAMLFTNDPLTAGTVVRATHVSEGRMAIDHVRALAGLGPGSYTETVSAGVIIKASHVTQMRTALDEALAGLGLSTAAYTDGTLTGVIVKAVHHQEIRNRVK